MEIPLFPLNTVLFPGGMLPLHIFEERYKLMVQRCQEREQPFGVVLIRAGQEVGGAAEPFEIGTTARITRVQPLANGRLNMLTIGGNRFRVRGLMHHEPYLVGEIDLLADEDEDTPGIDTAVARAGELFSAYTRLRLALTDEWTRRVSLPPRPGAAADHIASRIDTDARTKQRLLEELSVPRRLALEQRLLENGVVLLTSRLESVRRQKLGGFGVLN